MDHPQHALHILQRHAQAMGGRQQVRLQIARLVNLADQLRRDQQVHAGQSGARLIHQMFLQAGVGRGETVEIGGILGIAAADRVHAPASTHG